MLKQATDDKDLKKVRGRCKAMKKLKERGTKTINNKRSVPGK